MLNKVIPDFYRHFVAGWVLGRKGGTLEQAHADWVSQLPKEIMDIAVRELGSGPWLNLNTACPALPTVPRAVYDTVPLTGGSMEPLVCDGVAQPPTPYYETPAAVLVQIHDNVVAKRQRRNRILHG